MELTANLENESDVEESSAHWVCRAAFPLISGALVLCELLLLFLVRHDHVWLAFPLTLLISHLMHGQLIGFHEASHGMLRRNRRLNEVDGVFIGVFSLTSFSLYRFLHQTHHMHLCTEKDEEFWPFNRPGISRGWRMIAAFLELNLGLIFTPLLFLRTLVRANSPIRSRKVRRRIWAELGLMLVIWTVALFAVHLTHTWKYFLWMYLLPAGLAGNLQSWRKYIEHVGMTAQTVRGLTRSIVADGPLGRFVALTLLHEPYHGVHHQRAGVRHPELPRYAGDLTPIAEDDTAPFPSYRHALWHLLRGLANPRVGPQWRQFYVAK